MRGRDQIDGELYVVDLTVNLYDGFRWGRGSSKPAKKAAMRDITAGSLAQVRRLLAVLPDSEAPVVLAARTVERMIAANGDVPLPGPWPEADLLKEAVYQQVLSGLRPSEDILLHWATRLKDLVMCPWMGEEAANCPIGWLPLLERAVLQADQWLPKDMTRLSWKTHQIRKLTASLHWSGNFDPPFSAIIQYAEIASAHSCEACGKPVRIYDDILHTLCDEHHAMQYGGRSDIVHGLSYPWAFGLG